MASRNSRPFYWRCSNWWRSPAPSCGSTRADLWRKPWEERISPSACSFVCWAILPNRFVNILLCLQDSAQHQVQPRQHHPTADPGAHGRGTLRWPLLYGDYRSGRPSFLTMSGLDFEVDAQVDAFYNIIKAWCSISSLMGCTSCARTQLLTSATSRNSKESSCRGIKHWPVLFYSGVGWTKVFHATRSMRRCTTRCTTRSVPHPAVCASVGHNTASLFGHAHSRSIVGPCFQYELGVKTQRPAVES